MFVVFRILEDGRGGICLLGLRFYAFGLLFCLFVFVICGF